MIMVLGFCPSPHCHLSINQVSFNRRTDGQTRRLYASSFGEHRNHKNITISDQSKLIIFYIFILTDDLHLQHYETQARVNSLSIIILCLDVSLT